jgi:hypothetical protein
MEVVVGALLKIDDSKKADDEHDACRDANGEIGKLQLPGSLDAQLVLDKDELEDQGSDQGECCDMVQESEE